MPASMSIRATAPFAVDFAHLLAECDGYLVDGPSGEAIGVVEGVERDGEGGAVSALLVAAGWFGRQHLRVDTDAIAALVPGERRIIVREAVPVTSGRGTNAS